MKTWNLIDAQDHLEHIFTSAIAHRPQRIRQDFGRGEVVVLSAADYERLVTDHRLASVQLSSPGDASEPGRSGPEDRSSE